MLLKNYLNVYCGVFANRKYQFCQETRSVALFKGAVFPGVLLFKHVWVDFTFWSHCSSLLTQPSGSLNSLCVQGSARKKWPSLVDTDAQFSTLSLT